MKNMLLLSSSKYKNTGYLEHAIPWLQNFLTDYRDKTIAFVPYAGVRHTFDEYEKTVQNALSDLGMKHYCYYAEAKNKIQHKSWIFIKAIQLLT